MTDSTSVLPGDEWLARFIFRKEHVRPDGTLKPDPFIPFKHIELSATRHLGLSEKELWAAGDLVSAKRRTVLRGRGDAQASHYMQQRLWAVAAPEPDNLKHANVIGWPADKQSQKEIALELVKDQGVRFIAKPVSSI